MGEPVEFVNVVRVRLEAVKREADLMRAGLKRCAEEMDGLVRLLEMYGVAVGDEPPAQEVLPDPPVRGERSTQPVGTTVYREHPSPKSVLTKLPRGRQPIDGIADRNVRIMQLTDDGRTGADIADLLGVSLQTVYQVRNKMRKLHDDEPWKMPLEPELAVAVEKANEDARRFADAMCGVRDPNYPIRHCSIQGAHDGLHSWER
jgi:DNA-binding CsgD family transcriptional regulator